MALWNSILNLDDRILRGANSLVGHWQWVDVLVQVLSVYVVYLVPIILVMLWFYSHHSKKVALQAFGSGLLAWFVFSKFISHYLWYRSRPYVANDNLKELIFTRPDYSFPSDHAALLVALTVSVWLSGYRKLGIGLMIMAIVVGVTRVVAGVHYPLDVLAGAGIGFVAVMIVRWLDRPLTKYIYNPIIKITQKLHLS
jgi:undecaprenyl-diphosphatase